MTQTKTFQEKLDEILKGYFNHINTRLNNAEPKKPDNDRVEAIHQITELVEEDIIGKQRRYKDGSYTYWAGEDDLRQTQRAKLREKK